MSTTVKSSGSGIRGVAADLARVKRSQVLIGIPAEKAQRKGDPINSAALLFIHANGSELRHIPARPVLEPAIAANSEIISRPMGAAAKDLLNGNADAAEKDLNRAGVVASNAAKRWFTDPRNGWAPNAPETIKRKGSDKPLIDTGQLRKSITWVVRDGQ
jgi:hypothetical protein